MVHVPTRLACALDELAVPFPVSSIMSMVFFPSPTSSDSR